MANSRQVGGSHYQAPIQHWDFVESNGIPYLEAQVIKYVTRWEKKGGVQDLEKAAHFLQKLRESAPARMHQRMQKAQQELRDRLNTQPQQGMLNPDPDGPRYE